MITQGTNAPLWPQRFSFKIVRDAKECTTSCDHTKVGMN